MSVSDVRDILNRIEEQLATVVELDPQAQQAFEDLLNLVERLVADQAALQQEVQRLRQQLDSKKKAKTTNSADDDKPDSDHSSEKHRRRREKPKTKSGDRRSLKDLTIHAGVECPVDPKTLPPDAVRVADESVVVQDIEIKPRNIRFRRHVHYWATGKTFFRGPLPAGYDAGDFGADLRALPRQFWNSGSLKYCGNMSEPKIGEFLENFDVQISAGSLSNILTNTVSVVRRRVPRLVHRGLGVDALPADR